MNKSVISVTAIALKQLKNIINANDVKALTFGVKSGGCSGFEYYMKPTDKPLKKGDELYKKDGIEIYVCGMSLFHILGTEIDWKSDILGNCFTFNNPMAQTSCGCGTSFNINTNQ